MSKYDEESQPLHDEISDTVKRERLMYLMNKGLNEEISNLLVDNGFDPEKHVLKAEKDPFKTEPNKEPKHISKYPGVDDLLVLAYNAGVSLPALSRVFGWTQQTIGKTIEKYRDLRPKGRPLGYTQPDFNPAEVRKITTDQIAKMAKLYLEEDMTLGEIATIYKISSSTVNYLLTPLGIVEKPWIKRKPRSPKRDRNG